MKPQDPFGAHACEGLADVHLQHQVNTVRSAVNEMVARKMTVLSIG